MLCARRRGAPNLAQADGLVLICGRDGEFSARLRLIIYVFRHGNASSTLSGLLPLTVTKFFLPFFQGAKNVSTETPS